jgi:hypothetical protein
VANTVKPGGGVADDNVTTGSIQDDSVTASLQGYNGSAAYGSGMSNFTTLVSWTETLDAPGDIIAIATVGQGFSNGLRDWHIRIRIGGTIAFDVGGLASNDAPGLSGSVRFEEAGDQVVSLEWAAADGSVQVQAGRASMITLRRYK